MITDIFARRYVGLQIRTQYFANYPINTNWFLKYQLAFATKGYQFAGILLISINANSYTIPVVMIKKSRVPFRIRCDLHPAGPDHVEAHAPDP